MKILLIQLPVPNNNLSNLPLALGYLKANVELLHLPGLQVEILDRVSQDSGGDAFLLETILNYAPDIVGFSLYTWNSARSLGLIRAIKANAPEILTLGGGPEVNRDNNFIMGEATLDMLVFGEGERTFAELCRYFVTGRPDLRQIEGLGFRPYLYKRNRKADMALPTHGSNTAVITVNKNGRQIVELMPAEVTTSLAKQPSIPTNFEKRPVLELVPTELRDWVINTPRTAIEDVNLVPSAYLSGALDKHLSKFMSIELSRWCPSRCTFCYYGRQDLPRGGKRYFDPTRLKAEIEFGLRRGVDQFHFVEANFNTLPHLDRIFGVIEQTGANRQAHFYAEMRGEAIDEKEAARLQRSGFNFVEVGLQSAVPEVMAKVKRKNNLPRLIRGVHLLREHGIEVFLDAILGLPGETSDTFHQTLDFIAENDLAPYDLFHLQMLSGTELKNEAMAGKYGLVWQEAPPYFVLKTETLSFEDLWRLRRECLVSKGEDPNEITGLPQPSVFSLVEEPDSDVCTTVGDKMPLQRMVVDFEEELPDFAVIARRLASQVTVVLKIGEINPRKIQVARQILAQLSRPNPSGFWNIFVHSERALSATESSSLLTAVHHAEGYLDRLAVFTLQETDPARFKQWPSIRLYNIMPSLHCPAVAPGLAQLVAQIDFEASETAIAWHNRVQQVIDEGRINLLLNFPPNIDLAKVQETLMNLAFENRELWFTDWALAAGEASSQENDTAPRFPITVKADGQIYQVSNTKIDRAMLNWTLVERRLKRT